jgi:hypothetical protein
MFCSICGAGEQRTDAYCTRCGEWLTDMKSVRRHGRNRLPHSASTPEQRMRTMFVFNLLDALIALAAAILLIGTFINRVGTPGEVYVATSFCVVIAIHQIVSMVFNLKMQRRLKRARSATTSETVGGLTPADAPPALNAADSRLFTSARGAGVTDNTTELLGAVPQRSEQRQTR